jgi:hypothetical protein
MSLNHEKVLRLLHQNASAIVDMYDEALAIMFAVAWQPSLGDDLPFGTAVFKNGETKPEVMLSCLRQVPKIGLHLSSNMGNWMSKLQADVGTVYKLQGEVDDLKTRLSKYEAVETTQDIGPPGGGVNTRGTQGPRGSQ